MKCTTHRRPNRREEAVRQQERWAALSTAEKIASLDERLGKGIGAARQRKRIAELAATAHQRLPVSGSEAPPVAAEPTAKKTKAKERRAKEKATSDDLA